MKKISFLFVVTALAMFVFIFAAAAQEAELPAIDKDEAVEYLGTWYLNKMCFGENCMDLAAMGMVSTLTFNDDNTAVMEDDESTQTISWFMKDSVAFLQDQDENGELKDHELSIDKDGSLIMGEKGTFVYYVREIAPVLGTGALKADATFEDFAGEWFLNGLMFDGEVMPASMIGMGGSLIIHENTLDVDFDGEELEKDVAFTLTDGKLHFINHSADDNGKELEQAFILEYHEDNSVLLQMEGEEDNIYMIYVREADLSTGPSFFDIMGIAMDEESESEGK